MIDTTLVRDLIYFSLALVSTFLGIMIVTKCQGKLRASSLFLTSTLGLFVLYQVGNILGLYDEILNENLITNILHIFTITFILLALISIHQIISGFHSRPGKKPKNKK